MTTSPPLDTTPAPLSSKPEAPSELTSKELPYQQWCDAATLFAPFAKEPWALLLDSADCDHPDSRFDILLRQPAQVLSASVAELQQRGRDPFAELRTLLAQQPSYEGSHDLPFRGGAAGYFAYDLGRLLEPVLAAARPEHTAPKMADIALGFYQHALIIDHQQQRTYALAPVSAIEHCEEFWQRPHALGQFDFRLRRPWQSNMTQAEYTAKIEQIHHHLRAGDCYQINLAQRFSAPYEGDEWLAYIALREANRAPFSAYLRHPQGTVLSLSPERFLQTSRQGQVQTKPIKGTRPRHADPAEDQRQRQLLAAAEKDQAENLMIVDLLRNDLSRVCLPGSVRVPSLFAIESFNAVHHLVSTVTGQLSSPAQSIDLLRAAFPGGSITGAPKISAMQIIESLEPDRRSVYCGSIGYINKDGSSDTNIAIRTLLAAQGTMHCWAGGGIVMDSQAPTEYQETFDKVERILPVLAELGKTA